MIDRNNFGENLSNVYIRNIEIKNLNNIEGDNSLKIKIDFCVYDYYDSKTASKYLPNSKSSKRIAFLISKSKEMTDSIKENSIKLEDYKKNRYYTIENSEIIYTNVKKLIAIPKKLNKMMGSVEFITKEQPEHLSIFSCVQSINSGDRRQKIEEGPLTVEDIFISKRINQRSHYYVYKRTNTVWPGPVHEHQGVFMVNSFHTNTTHRELEKKEFLNIKIKDLRKKSFPILKNENKKFNNENTMFSEIYYSQNNNDGVSFCFLTNIEQMFLKNNNYENILNILDEETRFQIMNNLKIKEIQLFYNTDNSNFFKKFIHSRNVENEVYGHFSAGRLEFSDNLDNLESTYSYLEKYKFKLDDEHLFKGFIKEKNVKQIKVKIIINDPMKEFINSFMSNVKNNRSNLMMLMSYLNKNNFYDKENEMTTDLFINRFNNQRFMWLTPIKTYITMLRMFNKVDFQKEFINNFSLLNPKGINKNSLNYFIEQFNEVQINLEKVFSNVINKQSYFLTKTSSRRGNNNISFLEKKYDLNFVYKAKGIDYLDNDNSVFIESYNTSQILDLLQIEKVRYNSSFDSIPFINQEKIGTLNSSTKSESYINPKTIIYKNMILDCKTPETLTEKKIETFIDKTKIRINKKAFGSLYVDIITNDNNNLNTSFDYLNNNDLDNIIDQENKDIMKNKTDNRTIKKFQKFSKKESKFKRMLINKTNLNSENNILSNKSIAQIELMPIQQKALLTREYSSEEEKNNYLSNNKNKINLLHFNPCKINFLFSFKKNSNDKKALNSSTFVTIDQSDLNNLSKPILCRLEKYISNDFDTDSNSFLDYQILNQFFIIKPDNYSEEVLSRPINDDDALIRGIVETYKRNMDEVEFLRSSYVEQNTNRTRIRPSSRQRRGPQNNNTQQRQNNNTQQRQRRPNQRITSTRRMNRGGGRSGY